MFRHILIAALLASMATSVWYHIKANLLEVEIDELRTEMIYLKKAHKIELFEQSQKIEFEHQQRRDYEEIPSHIGTHTITL